MRKLKGLLQAPTNFSQEELSKVQEKFEKMLNAEIEFELEIDSSLYGGFRAVIDNVVYDLSIKSYLNRMHNYMQEGLETENLSEQIDKTVKNMKADVAKSLVVENIDKEIAAKVEDFAIPYDISMVGIVERTGDGVAFVRGLDDCKYGELLKFENDAYGIVMNLELERVGVVLLNGIANVSEGSMVRHTGSVVRVPVGESLLGRVINPLGQPLDDKGIINTEEFRNIEEPAPSIIERQTVNTPLQTGIMAIDSMIPIGRGQRELIIGDRQTGKTSIAIDTIINQKGKNVYCVYVAIAQKASTVAEIVNRLEEFGALEYTTVVVSTASDTAPMQYIAPYAGCSIAEKFMYEGKDVLVVYDDLSKHAVAYRTMSLLLRRPPGREAYPGDVFYLHSRLLERAAKLSDKLGGGSMTALPIVETMDGDISSYIPTNVISITDGQIYLETELFNSGQRPAINVGLSVSRVGGSAQIKCMRKVSGSLRLDLAQYRELAMFSQFASDLDKATRDVLANGERLTQTLIQPQYYPYSIQDQIVLLLMSTNKVLMDIPVKEVKAFNEGFISYVAAKCFVILEDIKEKGVLSEEQEETILKAAQEYKVQFKNAKKKSV